MIGLHDPESVTVNNVAYSWKHRPKKCHCVKTSRMCMWVERGIHSRALKFGQYLCSLFGYTIENLETEQPCCDYDFEKKLLEML